MIKKANNLTTENYFIAYFDILGYKEKMKTNSKEMLEKICKMIDLANEIISRMGNVDVNIVKKIFSDNFFFCTKNDYYELILFVSVLQALFIVFDFFVRGTLYYGELYIDENFVYGQGLIDAYEIESQTAIFPRIILDDSYFDAATVKIKNESQYGEFVSIDETSKSLQRNLSNEYYIDFDDCKYLNYLSSTMRYKSYTEFQEHAKGLFDKILINHQNNIRKNLKENVNNRKNLQKYTWCKNYHNKFCEENELLSYLI